MRVDGLKLGMGLRTCGLAFALAMSTGCSVPADDDDATGTSEDASTGTGTRSTGSSSDAGTNAGSEGDTTTETSASDDSDTGDASEGFDCRTWPFDSDGPQGSVCARHADCEPGLVCRTPGPPNMGYGLCMCPETNPLNVDPESACSIW